MAVIKCVIKARDKVEPVKDTDQDGIKGQCPTCQTLAPLTKNGFIGAHNVRNEPTPASPGLTEKQTPAIDKGATKASTIGAREGNALMDGAPLVKGRDMPPVQPMRKNLATGEIEVSSIGTMGGGLGREHLDRQVADERPKFKTARTDSMRNNYRKKQRRLAAKGLRQGNKG